MHKSRLEALSDGTFAIVFTLLVIEIRVPETIAHLTSAELWHSLVELAPLFVGYGVSFVVLSMFWISHNFFYNTVAKTINRQLATLNLLYLALIALIPFSAHLLGRYSELDLAVALYGLNVLSIGVVALIIFEYALRSDEIDSSQVTSRLTAQARIRLLLTPACTILGILSAFYFSQTLALVLFMFPVVFNVIPGLLDKTERLLGIRL